MRALDNVHFLEHGVINGDVDVFSRVTVPLVQMIVFFTVPHHFVDEQPRLHSSALFYVQSDVVGVCADTASVPVGFSEAVQRFKIPGVGNGSQDLPVFGACLLRLAFCEQLVAERKDSCRSGDTFLAR